MKQFVVYRPKDQIVVAIMKHKGKDAYSYVNFTKGHICPCEFDSIEDAVHDMDRLKENGYIIDYEEVDHAVI